MTQDKPSFRRFLPDLIDSLDSVADTYLDSYDEHRAFAYFIAENFETTETGRFVYTDGAKDGGIDFYISASPSYAVYQCKCPNLDRLKDNSVTTAPTYDQSVLEELLAAIDMLRDTSGTYDVKTEVKRLRGDYQRDNTADSESTSLTATLAIMGTLTAPAMTAFNSFRQQLANEGISLRLIQWQNIYRKLHSLESPEDVELSFDIHVEDKRKDLLSHRDYCYALAYAYDFYEAFRKHEWNLFDWNVRYEIPNSLINKRIVKSLLTRQGRLSFHHLNNGILVTCTNYSGVNRSSDNAITVNGAQIINGCQTVRAISEAYEDLSPEQQKEFREEARVQVKIIRDVRPDFIAKLVVSTNDQNPMKPRNLKSNSYEQRTIQAAFRKLQSKWFYQRKDGEWKSLATTSSRIRWFRSSDYVVPRQGPGSKRYRIIDNEGLAKAWYAFIGYSGQALSGSVNYFEEDVGGVYPRVFKSIPTQDFWGAFSLPSFRADFQTYFEPGTPSVHQYLLAYGISQYIDGRKTSTRQSKANALQRALEEGELEGDPSTGLVRSSPEDQGKYLNRDAQYNVDRMINYGREVLIELFSFVLSLKYTSCDAVTCQKIIALTNLREYFRFGCQTDLIPVVQDGNAILGPTYDFIRDCIRSFYFAHDEEMRAAPRLRAYLGRRSTINDLRRTIVNRNRSTSDWEDPTWKLRDRSFLDSLPDLE
jgi:hypothetical protein